ncbi:hypothetical protein [Lacticaseibacillus paracasei]|uniref:hypothetical protein n=1 Tax=Lacticaseibacillus paracasei TaxID=1597 RepID=UPI0003436EBA|nr:hypothetical protein [Lacticaseibacillus paracasei]EPC17341.1 hypothetical protein Lpp230_0742 [Lacticaseibacillus paracasei subsp. paracasei Lpp230]MCT3361000.1 hypothetical protein [Lacticaseibacillus paracasei]MDP0527642.1 hypothetical protein [Lacticaseibacillus paracasei]QKK93672.1 hypothetical protein FBD73_11925 [Lacticaseibacillus paracasei]UNG77172.1 hypothetical protein LJ555_08370 [Lacticaseibacillus paracasei]
MRVTDLLALLADQNKNASVLLDTKPTPSRFDDFKLTTVNDQPQLIFQPNPERKAALHVWELQLLLNQPDLQQRFVYLADVDEPRALFGFVKRQIGLLLN